MTFIRMRSPLGGLLDAVARAVDAADRPAAVAAALARHATDPALLRGQDLSGCPERYRRVLLHADPDGRYAVVALVWLPGQMSPVHAHRVWCAFAVHRGILAETLHGPGDPPVPQAIRLLGPGQGAHAAADPALAHRLANLGCGPAVSLHCYGVAFDRFGDGVNDIRGA